MNLKACHPDVPAMVQGAALSGIDAVNQLLQRKMNINSDDKSTALFSMTVNKIIIIGAGVAG